MINTTHKTLWLHAYLRSVGDDMHIAVISRFAANAVHRKVYPVPWFLSYHKLFKYFSALAK